MQINTNHINQSSWSVDISDYLYHFKQDHVFQRSECVYFRSSTELKLKLNSVHHDKLITV